MQVEQDPMKLCFPTKESYQHIRAVALEPGGASMHTHRAIHWGSTGRQGNDVSATLVRAGLERMPRMTIRHWLGLHHGSLLVCMVVELLLVLSILVFRYHHESPCHFLSLIPSLSPRTYPRQMYFRFPPSSSELHCSRRS